AEVVEGIADQEEVAVAGGDALTEGARAAATLKHPLIPEAKAESEPPRREEDEGARPAPSEATSASAAAAPPAEGGTFGMVKLPRSAAGHRIFIDEKLAGNGPSPLRTTCGAHTVRIGSRGVPRPITVPCGGAVEAE